MILTVITFEHIIKLIEVIIWPLTIVIILLIFRKQFQDIFGRIGSMKATSTGIEFSFEKKIIAAKQLLKSINPMRKSKGIRTEIHVNDKSPYQQLNEMDLQLVQRLKYLAQTNDVKLTAESGIEICNQLKRIGIILLPTAKLITAFFEISINANNSFNQSHLNDVKEIYNEIQL